jgi:hypothetical protein
MPAVMRAAAVVEKAGVPAVAIGAGGFESMGRVVARALGVSDIPIASYPGVILTDAEDEFRRKVSETVAPQVRSGLVSRLSVGPAATAAAEPTTRSVFLRGSFDEVQEEMLRRGMSDGLPVVPPTAERVERFLAFTDRSPDEVLGILPPDLRPLSVWSVAAHGVMAGCRPEYMPILLALGECMADPGFRLEDAGSTPGWEPLAVLSGPIAGELDFNAGTGVMRVGRQANTSVGRWVRMLMRNAAGLRPPPGDTDQGAIASTFNVVLAEDEAASRATGWPPHRADEGFGPDDDMVSLRSVVTISAPIYSAGSRAEDHLRTIADLFGRAIGPWAWTGVAFGAWHPLLVLGPSIARTISADGWSKDDIRRYLYDNVRGEAAWMEECAEAVGRTGFRFAEVVRRGEAPAVYAESDDPRRLVPMFLRPESISIVVAGSPVRNQSRAYVNNHAQGAPVARRVERPASWRQLLQAEQRRTGARPVAGPSGAATPWTP